jgi:hypothetical protein
LPTKIHNENLAKGYSHPGIPGIGDMDRKSEQDISFLDRIGLENFWRCDCAQIFFGHI